MEVFLAVAALLTLALLSTSTRFYAFRRSRFVTLLVSGGWPAVLVGFLVGPSVGGLIDLGMIRDTTPLVILALGWAGLTIGLQARWAVLRSLPRAIIGVVALDVVLSILILGPGIAGLIWLWVRENADPLTVFAPATLLVACALGWAMETRSLQRGEGQSVQVAGVAVRVSGAFSSIIAVALLGTWPLLISRGPQQGLVLAPGPGLGVLIAIIAEAVLLGVLGRFIISRTERSVAEQLAVFLGIVAFVGGLAAEQGATPLLGAMLAGAVFANLISQEALRFERFILQAEHIVAVILFLIAGMLADTRIGIEGLAIAFLLAVWRSGVKPRIVVAGAGPSGRGSSPGARLLRVSVIRQSPIAVALALSFVVIEPSPFNQKLLAIVLLSGVMSELLTLVALSRQFFADEQVASTGPAPQEPEVAT